VGKAHDPSGVYEVMVNGIEASISADGLFTADAFLAVGENQITITATDTRQNTGTETFLIERSGGQVAQNIPDFNKLSKDNNYGLVGDYYALIIGINDYDDDAITDLDQPMSDAQKLYNVLTTKYRFDPRNVKLLKNAGFEQMIDAFDGMRRSVGPADNLLVFYAGHGYWDEERELGYWLVLLHRIFGGQADTVLKNIRDVIKSELENDALLFPAKKLSGKLSKTIKSITVDDEFLENIMFTQKDDRYAFPILALLYPHLDYKNNDFNLDHKQ